MIQLIKPYSIIALIGLANPLSAETTALDCIPPLPPPTTYDAATIREYRAEIKADFSTYFDQSQTYLRCLAAAQVSATQEIQKTLSAYENTFATE